MHERIIGLTGALLVTVAVALLSLGGGPRLGVQSLGFQSLDAQMESDGAGLIVGATNVAYLGPTLDLPGALTNTEGAVSAVWDFDAFAPAGQSPWRLWSPDLPAIAQGFSRLQFGRAYFIVSDEARHWDFAQDETPSPPGSVQLAAGGNNVVYFGATTAPQDAFAIPPAEPAAAALGTAQIPILPVLSVWFLDQSVWTLWNPDLPPALQQLTELVFGRAYFVTTSEAFEWGFPPLDPPVVDPPLVEPPVVPPSIDPDRLRALVGPLLSDDEIAEVVAGLQPAHNVTASDRLSDPSLEFAVAGAFRFDFDAAEIAAFQAHIAGAELAGTQLMGLANATVGLHDVVIARLLAPPHSDDGIDRQYTIASTLAGGLNKAFTPDLIGIGRLGINWMAYLGSPLAGWVNLTALNPLDSFRVLPSDAFGYARDGNDTLFLAVPTAELAPDVLEVFAPDADLYDIIPHIGAFGRRSPGTPSALDPTVVSTVTLPHSEIDPFTFRIRAPNLPGVTGTTGTTFPSDAELCVPSDTSYCLSNGRIKVGVRWKAFDGTVSPGRVSSRESADDGSFWFFDPDNIELVVKALDGRQINGHWWIFYGSLTNVEFELTVTDTAVGLVKTYSNSADEFASFGDTNAF